MEQKRKIYVKVVAEFDTEGRIMPVSLTWEDGTVYEIDRVLECRKAASQKAGGVGDRFTIRVQGKERYLWFENPAWFVEGTQQERSTSF